MNSGFFATADGVKVIEFNARFGDPECMNIMSLFRRQLAGGHGAHVRWKLAQDDVPLGQEASLVLYLVSPDYALRAGRPYEFALDRQAIEAAGCHVFFASAVELGENATRPSGPRARWRWRRRRPRSGMRGSGSWGAPARWGCSVAQGCRRRELPERPVQARRRSARRWRRARYASSHLRRSSCKDGAMIVERATHPQFLSNTYLVADGEGGPAFFVDAGGPVEPLIDGGRAPGADSHARAPHPPPLRPRMRGRRRCASAGRAARC